MYIKYFGDVNTLIQYVGQAKKYLYKLKDSMEELGLPSLSKTHYLNGVDISIKVESRYGEDFIYLYGNEEPIYFIAYMGDDTNDFSNKKYYRLDGSVLEEVSKEEIEEAKGIRLLDDGLYIPDILRVGSLQDLLNPDFYLYKGDIDNKDFLGIPSHILPFPAKVKKDGYYRYVLNISYEQEQFNNEYSISHYNFKVIPICNPSCQLVSNFFNGTPAQTYVSSYTNNGIIYNEPYEFYNIGFIGNVLNYSFSNIKDELHTNCYSLLNGNILSTSFDKDTTVYKTFLDTCQMGTGWSSGNVNLNKDKLYINTVYNTNLNGKYVLNYPHLFCCVHCRQLENPNDTFEQRVEWCNGGRPLNNNQLNWFTKYKKQIESINGDVISEIDFTNKDNIAYISQYCMSNNFVCSYTDKPSWKIDSTVYSCYNTPQYPKKAIGTKLFPDYTYKERWTTNSAIAEFPFSGIKDDIKLIHSTTKDGGLNYRRFQKTNEPNSGNILTAKVGVYCNNKLVEESNWFSVIQRYNYRNFEDTRFVAPVQSYILQQNYDIVAGYNSNGFDILFYRKYSLKGIKRYPFIFDDNGTKTKVFSNTVSNTSSGSLVMINDVIAEVTNHIYVNGKVHTLKPKSIQHELYLDIDKSNIVANESYTYSIWQSIFQSNPSCVAYGADGYGNIIEEEDSTNEQIIRPFIDSNESYAMFIGDVFPLKVYRRASITQIDNIYSLTFFDIDYPTAEKIYIDYNNDTYRGNLIYPSDGNYKTPNDRLWLIFSKNGSILNIKSPVKTNRTGDVITDELGKPKIWNRCNGAMVV